ncbi:carbon-nitrogen hydrolase family protein [Gemmatimonadota bacterium]
MWTYIYMAMRAVVLLLVFLALPAPRTAAAEGAQSTDKILLQADGFQLAPGAQYPAGWTTNSRLSEFCPDFNVAIQPSLDGPGSLRISGGAHHAASGCWQTVVEGISPERWYGFEAFFQAKGVAWPKRQAMARLYWLDGQGCSISMPEFVPESHPAGDWQPVAATYRPPKNTAAVRIELFLSHCPQGEVYWDRISLKEVPEPPSRIVKVGSANCRPTGRSTNLGMAEQFIGVIEQAGRAGCDILLLGETITLPARGSTPTMEKAEPVPGPITGLFGRLAKKYGMYIIVGLLENEHGTLYNTAALIDRQGGLAGKYRKVHLPLGDLEIGVTPGDHYPVFDTDFGRIGIMICYDQQFVDPARALALQGAEILFCPNWGSKFPPSARAMENRVYIANSGYDTPTDIVDPNGEVIAKAEERPGVAMAEIDLNRPLREAGFARKKQYLQRELRPDIRVTELER